MTLDLPKKRGGTPSKLKPLALSIVSPPPVPPQGGALINATDIRFPWDKQLNETDGEYACWKLYFDQGPGRSFERLAIVTNRTIEFLKGLSDRLNWGQRTTAYEAYVDSVVGTLVKKQITGNQQTATRVMGEVISHQVSRLAQKILLEPPSEDDTAEDILGQLQGLVSVFKALKSGKGDTENAKSRSINIMFAPTIQAGDAPMEVKTTYADVDDNE